MELQEYHVKRLMKQAGLPMLKGGIAYTADEAFAVAQKLRQGPFVVKPQIMGKNACYGRLLSLGENEDGCLCVATAAEVKQAAEELLESTPAWAKSSGTFCVVEKVYVEQKPKVDRILGRLVFRVNFEKQCRLLLVSDNVGIEGEFIFGRTMDEDMLNKAGNVLAKGQKAVLDKVVPVLKKAHRLFVHYGAVAVELSPLVLLTDGSVRIVDARLIFDPASTTKFPELIPLIESRVGRERERQARQNHFRYIGLNGNIACVVNGIGLGWATIDLIQRKGGRVGALLDVGTEPTPETVMKAVKLVLSEPNVDAVLVNIFGGLTRCDLIAEGLIAASPEMATGLPFVVRMDGVNAEAGQRLLFESRLPFIVKTRMDEAVRVVIHEMKARR
ncbi:MAG: hypothetical protein II942_04810 [Alphaproteobacteria bacterium]|nr:hypothetical protein [Alphaproteobacteria bacterium]